jgi:hypothetical protein
LKATPPTRRIPFQLPQKLRTRFTQNLLKPRGATPEDVHHGKGLYLGWKYTVMEQLVAFVGPFVVGLLVGVLAKRILSVALILIALFIALAAIGYMSPEQVTGLLQQLGYAAEDALDSAMKIKDAVPYSSVAFLIGLAIGLWKG